MVMGLSESVLLLAPFHSWGETETHRGEATYLKTPIIRKTGTKVRHSGFKIKMEELKYTNAWVK
jgi:hypothetical protein